MTDRDVYARLADLVGLRGADDNEAELRAALRRSPRLRERLDDLNRVHTLLSDGDAPPRPSDELRERVLAIPALEGGRPTRRVGRFRLLPVAAALIGLALVSGVLVVRERAGDPATLGAPVALVASSGSGMEATIQLGEPREGRQDVRLTARGLRDDGHPYALWLIGADGGATAAGAILVGEFAPDGKGECVVVLSAASGDWRAAVVTQAGETPATGTMARANLRST